MRIRTIKPDFFLNERLADLDPLVRIVFAGLWCVADKAGRLEDRPRRLKAQLAPYDDLDMDRALAALAAAGHIVRYSSKPNSSKPINESGDQIAVRLIAIPSFLIHQRPRADEPDSELPPPPDQSPNHATSPERDGSVPPQVLISTAAVTDQYRRSDGSARGKERNGMEGNKERNGSDSPDAARPPPAFTADQLVEIWNGIVQTPIPQVRKLTPDRRRQYSRRIARFPVAAEWQAAIQYLQDQPWTKAPGTGTHTTWTASLEWLTRYDNPAAKYIEAGIASTAPDQGTADDQTIKTE